MDARLPDRAAGDPVLDGLSDAAHRVWTTALAWSVGQGTDGRVPRTSLRFLHPDGPRPDVAAELVAAGVWVADGDGWRNRRYQQAQTTAKEAERLREQNRIRQANLRQRKRAQTSRDSHANSDAGERDAGVTDSEGGPQDSPEYQGSDARPSRRDGPVTGQRDSGRDGVRQGEVLQGKDIERASEVLDHLARAVPTAATHDGLRDAVTSALAAGWRPAEIIDAVGDRLPANAGPGLLAHRVQQLAAQESPAATAAARHAADAKRHARRVADETATAAAATPPPAGWRNRAAG